MVFNMPSSYRIEYFRKAADFLPSQYVYLQAETFERASQSARNGLKKGYERAVVSRTYLADSVDPALRRVEPTDEVVL